jgi:hypothetical protein
VMFGCRQKLHHGRVCAGVVTEPNIGLPTLLQPLQQQQQRAEPVASIDNDGQCSRHGLFRWV